MMTITYLAHSGFFVETDSAYLLFDYFEEDVPARAEGKPLYVFVSHAHADHFNPDIFNLKGEKIYYLLSYDTEKKIKQRHILQYAVATMEQIRFVRYDEAFGEGPLWIRTLKSNDKGVAYLVEVDGMVLYHAGDLNLWMKEGASKAINNNCKALFDKEMEKIKDCVVDVAFLPADPGLGTHIFDGIRAFTTVTKTSYVFPMHMWKSYEFIDALEKEMLPESVKIMRPDAPGKTFTIEKS